MTSRLTGKPSKKDRPKSSDKLRKNRKDGGTPEKPSTPNASQIGEAEEEVVPQIIMNDEILALQIKPENLAQLREPHPPGPKKISPKSTSVTVRKLKPASEWDRPKPKTVLVAKPAPPDAPLLPTDYSHGAGARFTEGGEVVPHSILGSVEDYKVWAREAGALPQELTEARPDSQQGRLSVKYEKKKKSVGKGFPKFQSVHESNALQNWQDKMVEWKKQQGYLAKHLINMESLTKASLDKSFSIDERLLDKPQKSLIMNQADDYRVTQEQRYLMDRTIAHVDDGKGYRIGSEFWKQPEPIGDDLTGRHMTVGQTEMGYPPPIEHVQVPDAIKKEKGVLYMSPRNEFHKPWHRNPYLAQRLAQLQPMMDELDPHQPEIGPLAITGSGQPWDGRRPWTGGSRRSIVATSDSRRSQQMTLPQELMEQSPVEEEEGGPAFDPLAEHPDVYPEPVFGPSILFAGQTARWTGHSSNFQGQVGIEARVTFEAFAGRRTTSFLEIVNDGTTSIYYNWKKVPKTNPFDMANPNTQRFYFNTSPGVILPGDQMKFPFVFKSLLAGVYSEQWQLETSPVVCGGASLVVMLRGVALQEDKYKPHRCKIEKELSARQAQQIVSEVLDELLRAIQSPDRPTSPMECHTTEEDIFTHTNPDLCYVTAAAAKLNQCHQELFPEEEREDAPVWDLSVINLKQTVLEQKFPGVKQKESSEEEVENEEAAEANFNNRKQSQLQFINQCVQTMAFPTYSPQQEQMYIVGFDVLCDMVDTLVGAGAELRQILGLPDRDDIPQEQGDPSDVKKGAKGAAGKADPKGKGLKDAKSSGKVGKEPATKPVKTGTLASKRLATKDKTNTERNSLVSSPQSPSMFTIDPINVAKYKEKLYSQAHRLVEDTMAEFGRVLSEVDVEED